MRTLFSLFVSIVLMVLVVAPAAAQNLVRTDRVRPAKADRVEAVQQRRTDAKDQVEDRVADRCERIEQKIDTQLARYANNTDRHQRHYARIQAWLTALVERLSSSDVDTTELERVIAVFNEKVDQFAADVAAYMEALRATQAVACGESDGAFKEALAKARALLKVVHDDAADLRNYWQTTLRPAIRTALAESSNN